MSNLNCICIKLVHYFTSRFSNHNSQAYLYMVTDCPTSFWPSPPHTIHNHRLLDSDDDLGSVIRDKCERSSSEGHPYTYHLDLPVHSMGSGLWSHLASCNCTVPLG